MSSKYRTSLVFSHLVCGQPTAWGLS